MSQIDDLNVGDTLRIFLDPTTGEGEAGYNKDTLEDEIFRDSACSCFLKWEEIEKHAAENGWEEISGESPKGELIWAVEKIEPIRPWLAAANEMPNSTHVVVIRLLNAENLAHIDETILQKMNDIQHVTEGGDWPRPSLDLPAAGTSKKPFRITVALIEHNGIIYINHSDFFSIICSHPTDPSSSRWPKLNNIFSRGKKNKHRMGKISRNPSVWIAEKTGHRASEWGTYTATLGETHEQKEVEEIITALHVLYEEKDEFWGPQSDELGKAQYIQNFLKLLWEIPEAKQYHIDPLLKNYKPGDYVYDKVKEYIYSLSTNWAQTEHTDWYAMSSDPETYWQNAQGGGRKKRRKRKKTKRKKSKRKKTKRRKSKKK